MNDFDQNNGVGSKASVLNGQLLNKNTHFFSQVYRAFAFGDGLFETMRAYNGKVFQLHYHIERLLNGCKALGLEPVINPQTISSAYRQILNALGENTGTAVPAHRLRLTLWRAGQGAYWPYTNNAHWLLMAFPLQTTVYTNHEPIRLGIVKTPQLLADDFSRHKTLNALPYIQAARYAKLRGWADGLILNTDGRIPEATSSNVFYQLRNGRWYTPPLSDGCVAGVMRQPLLEDFKLSEFEPEERPILQVELSEVTAMFLTNMIRGVVPVHSIDDIGWVTSDNIITPKLVEILNSRLTAR